MLRNASNGQMFAVYSTVDIIAEVMYNWRRKYPTKSGNEAASIHDRIVSQLDDRIDDFQIDNGFPGHDVNDQHVHAAAVASGAQIVLTADGGFTGLTEQQKDALPYDILTSDEFFVLVDDSNPDVVRQVTNEQRTYWEKRQSSRSLADQLVVAGCPDFGNRVRNYLDG